jgi:hypothetical protein
VHLDTALVRLTLALAVISWLVILTSSWRHFLNEITLVRCRRGDKRDCEPRYTARPRYRSTERRATS